MLAFHQRILNLRPDAPDQRDRDFRYRHMELFHGDLPTLVNWNSEVGPVDDQGKKGRCVGHAAASLMHWLHLRRADETVQFSANWIWIGAKEIDDSTPSVAFEGAGTTTRDALKFLRKYGACVDELWPLEAVLPRIDLEQAIIQDASAHRIAEYWRIGSDHSAKQHLATVGPLLVGVPVYENWERIGPDGRVPAPDGALLGGHQLLGSGYDVDGWWNKNSWGKEHGFHGFLHLPYDYPVWDRWGAR
jgi:hypothetical protein